MWYGADWHACNILLITLVTLLVMRCFAALSALVRRKMVEKSNSDPLSLRFTGCFELPVPCIEVGPIIIQADVHLHANLVDLRWIIGIKAGMETLDPLEVLVQTPFADFGADFAGDKDEELASSPAMSDAPGCNAFAAFTNSLSI
jgi:hypothetical protein